MDSDHLPHCGVDLVLPVALDKFDNESADDDDNGTKCIAKDMKEDAVHVELCTRL